MMMSTPSGGGSGVDPESYTEKAWEAISATPALADQYSQQAYAALLLSLG